jgi:hypothetical protein
MNAEIFSNFKKLTFRLCAVLNVLSEWILTRDTFPDYHPKTKMEIREGNRREIERVSE